MRTRLRRFEALFGMLCCVVVSPHLLAAQNAPAREDAREQLARLGLPFSEESFRAQCIDGRADVVELFLRAGMGADVEDAKGQTLLTHSAFSGHAAVVEHLLAAGARVDHPDMHDATPLMYAVSEGHVDVVKKLLAYGANPNRVDAFHEWTPAMYAAFEGYPAILDLLIDAGGDVNYQDPQRGFSALMYAAFQGHAEVVERLLEAGADAHATNIFGESALVLADRRGFEGITGLLESGR